MYWRDTAEAELQSMSFHTASLGFGSQIMLICELQKYVCNKTAESSVINGRNAALTEKIHGLEGGRGSRGRLCWLWMRRLPGREPEVGRTR